METPASSGGRSELELESMAKSKKSVVTFGSDPEFMLRRDGQFFSAIPIVPGTKTKRFSIGRHHIYYDNVMAECAVAPSDTSEEFVENIRDCLKRYADQVKPFELVPQASADFPKNELKSPESQEIGCDPEYDAYGMCVAEAPQDQFKSGTLRTAGGHIHLGTSLARAGENDGATYNLLAIVRLCDLFVGTASIFLDKDPTTGRRKQLYGKAGRFRQPEHGVEYRSLGNFWLTSPKLVLLILDICEFIVHFVGEGKHENGQFPLWRVDYAALNDDNSWNKDGWHPSQAHRCVGYDVTALRDAIDTMNKKTGMQFLIFACEILDREGRSDLHERITSLMDCGPYDLYKEWNL